MVDEFATHPLSCKKSEGRFFHHSTINSIIHHAFAAAAIPTLLELTGLLWTDGKRPDGVTMVPWNMSSLLSGILHAQTHLLHPIELWQSVHRAQWQYKLR